MGTRGEAHWTCGGGGHATIPVCFTMRGTATSDCFRVPQGLCAWRCSGRRNSQDGDSVAMNKHTAVGRLLTLMLLGAVVGTACSRSPTAPAVPVACAFVVSTPTSSFGPAGGNGSVSVEAPAGCGWSATTPADWIAIQSPAAGSGSGVLGVAVAALPSGAEARSGLITIAQQAFTLTQSACEFSLAPVGTSFGGEGGTATINLAVQDGCRWTVDEAPAWATVEPASGTGPTSLSLRVGENSLGTVREASLRVASARLAFSQAAQDCGFSLTPRNRLFAPAAGEGLADVSTAAGCRWTISADDEWVTVAGGRSGVWPGLVRFSLAANPGAPSRRTRLRAGDALAELTQNGQDACAVRLSSVEALRGWPVEALSSRSLPMLVVCGPRLPDKRGFGYSRERVARAQDEWSTRSTVPRPDPPATSVWLRLKCGGRVPRPARTCGFVSSRARHSLWDATVSSSLGRSRVSATPRRLREAS